VQDKDCWGGMGEKGMDVGFRFRVVAVLSVFIGGVWLNSCSTVSVSKGNWSNSGRHVGKKYDTKSWQRGSDRHDVVHTVAPGETVWRLAKMYDVKERDILRANALKESSSLYLGQKLRIPHAAEPKAIIPLYPSKKWKYIIIHHTATDAGNSLIFNRAHLRRGFDRGIGYHFVIDNGSCGKGDGMIEVTPRWLKQQDGAHCKANDMNRQAIGIALVGNFDKDKVSQKQMEALVELVNLLRKYYHIPLSRIMGHGQVPGAATDCPGKRFPWKEFRQRLNSL